MMHKLQVKIFALELILLIYIFLNLIPLKP